MAATWISTAAAIAAAAKRPVLLAAMVAGAVFGGTAPAEAQSHRFRLFVGPGVQFFARPELKLGRGIGFGGTAAMRLNDNWSLESGLFFGRSNRRYTAGDDPVEDVIAEAAYQFRTNRYHLDGSLVHHFGRRQPFHTYVFAGAGLLRRDEVREDLIYPEPEEGQESLTGLRFPLGHEVTLQTTDYSFSAHLGAGFEVYVFDYLSAVAEYRIWIPGDFTYRTQQAIVGVNYYR